ncbi:LacI family DNA-binding transcriptional regulator [Flavihumibacter petaseus]|uniref:Putative LacI family transcriptional regulator n=1 Tax=Flavihumibacter petaseus NBRC 106054 TaxID=1220578 RepID=A0A0E9MYI2_9BACT|nr:LacI family DNA-binding transcriptional regulator [Flavihumibacter petaseus]GAO42649.1 putative LacI family transcriptional regulator [Flavihumibacter petaseus NBRC 106054]
MSGEVTIYDIAEKLGLSAATVSRALKDNPAINSNTKKKIRAAAEAMGYRSNRFASNLRKRTTNTIGVVVPRLNSNFMSTAISAMEKMASDAGYSLIIVQSLESPAKEIANIRTLFNSRVDGLMAALSSEQETDIDFRILTDRGIPVVFFDQVPSGSSQPCIIIDNAQAAHAITMHLIGQGCKRIVHLTGNVKRFVYRERLSGYKMALLEAGIPFDEELVLHSDLTELSAPDIANRILEMDGRPDALFAANDMSAAACLTAFRERGLSIPGDIAVAGFNNDPISRLMQPNITTINYPAYQIGATAATYLLNHLTGKSSLQATNKVILHADLLVRESTMRLPHNDQLRSVF